MMYPYPVKTAPTAIPFLTKMSPAMLTGEMNLVVVGFNERQQSDVASWRNVADQLTRSYPTIEHSEIQIDRSKIRKTDRFMRKLKFPNDDRQVYVMLVTQRGERIWHSKGAYTPEKGGDMFAAVAEALMLFNMKVAPRRRG